MVMMTNFGAINPNSLRQKILGCRSKGLVFDAIQDGCRPKRYGGGRGVRRSSGPTVAEIRAACKAQGLVYDRETKKCREDRRGMARRARRSSGTTVAGIRSACKAQGLVYDRETKKCREDRRKLVGLERAYAKGSLFNFGVTLPPSDQRQGIVYHSPASDLGTSNYYPYIGPLARPPTGAASFELAASVLSPQEQKQFGVGGMGTASMSKKVANFGRVYY